MNDLTRREFITRTPLVTVALYALTAAGCRSEESQFIDVETGYGKLRGIRERGVNVYKGVPYAGRVSGDRRFRSPAPLESWTGIREALQLGHPSIQIPNQTYGINEPEPAEDCLVLNIWTPNNDNDKRPVMFYNHGGGFSHGSGGSVAQDGANLARNFDVVVVQTNHRLGLLGYLYLDELAGEDYAGSGNMGMLDIVEGLKWVYENIAEFGGDPDNVMVFGESGGGAKTSCLYAMPAAASYFNKASIESGPGIRMTDPAVAAETTFMLLRELNIAPEDWRRLLEVPAADLLDMQVKLPQLAARASSGRSLGIGSAGPGGFGPMVDGVALPIHPFDPTAPEISRDKPLMVGWNEDEYTFFGLVSGDTAAFQLDETGLQERLNPQFGEDTNRIIDTFRRTRPDASPSDIFVAINSLSFAGFGSIYIAEKKAQQNGVAAYLYNFGYKSETKIPGTDYELGTPHAMDIAFKFNNVAPTEPGEENRSLGGNRPERLVASHNMAEMWTTFARSGKPGARGQPEWPPYTLPERPTMRIDTQCEVIYDRYREERQLWESLD